jgi:hypothetical protein
LQDKPNWDHTRFEVQRLTPVVGRPVSVGLPEEPGSRQGEAPPLGAGCLALGVQGGGSAPARGWGESPILGIELGAEGAGAKLRRISDGRVYSTRIRSTV